MGVVWEVFGQNSGAKIQVLKSIFDYIVSTASGALVVGGVRDRWIPSHPIPGDSFECSME